ncbi:MAG: TonB-dependent receptor domain-containing protein, partial [Candidatus Binatia bacterium]
EISGEPLPGWKLSVAGTLLDSEFTDGDPVTLGNSVTGTADWQVGLYTSYEMQSGPLQGLGFGVGLFAIDDRSAGEFFSAKLEGYNRVDFNAFYKGFRHFEIQLQVRNAFDEKYVEGSDRVGGFNQFGAPTAVLLTLRYTFD